VVAGSTAALPECAPARLAASITGAQQGDFPLVARAASAVADSTAEAAGVSAARRRLLGCTWDVLKNS